MPWVKLDDAFPEHPKILAVGGNAAWLHVCAIAYCNRNLTDGYIPAFILVRLSDRKQPRTLAARLVEAGLWESAGDGWQIHDFLEYQTSKAKVEQVRADARERMANARNGHSHNVHANKARTSRNPTTVETETQTNDNDAPHRNGSSSSSDNRQATRNEFAFAAARLLANKRNDLTNRNGWIQRTAKGLLKERLADVDHCIDHGYSMETAMQLLTTDPVEQSTPLQPAWNSDPNCDICPGDGWVKDDDGCLRACSCQRAEPYPAKAKLGIVK